MTKKYSCDNCGKILNKRDLFYTLRVEMFASAKDLEFTDEDLKGNHLEKIEKLIEEMEGMDVDELNDQVYENYEFDLCPDCREFFPTIKTKKVVSESIKMLWLFFLLFCCFFNDFQFNLQIRFFHF